jgi:hypothetical protein
MRVKSTWFNEARPKSAGEIGGAMAFISWRIAQNALKSMREADFDIDPGPQYFEFLAETLVFIVMVADRIAYHRIGAPGREEFTTALANHAAGTLAENQARLLATGGEQEIKAAFIDLVNRRSGEYAEFAYGADGPSFVFLRYFASLLAEFMPEKDKRWTFDQVIAIEAPEIVATVEKGMKGLLGMEPKRARRATAGE